MPITDVLGGRPKQAESPRHRAIAARRESRSLFQALLPLLIVLVGLGIGGYPVVATIYANANQAQTSMSYTQQVTDGFDEAQRNAAIESARRWNTMYAGAPILDPWLARIDNSNEDYNRYLNELNLNEAMGRIKIPSINSDLPIYHGTDMATLDRGIGHLYGSSLPVGGAPSHAVLTGHTGLTHATLWDNLSHVRQGDAIFMDVAGMKMKYVVTATEVVLPNTTDELAIVPGKDVLTLITCTPYGVNSHRLLVHAERSDFADDDLLQFSQIQMPWQWWMSAVLVALGSILLLVLYAIAKTISRYVARQREGEVQEGKLF